MSRENKTIDALGHSCGEWTTTKEPTCTETGSKERVCSTCGHKETEELEALGHSWEEDWTIDVEATCEHAGSKSHHCSRCDEVKDSTAIDQTDHIGGIAVRENEVAATCTEAGSYEEVIYCKYCNTELSRENKTIDALGHSCGEWTTTKEPTCLETGSKERVCSACGHKETEELEALGHNWEEDWTIDVEATCEHAGSKSHHCSRCDEVKDVTEIAQTNHPYGDWTTTKEPTCTEAGSKERVCSTCGHKETEELEALGHSWEEEWTTDVEATCEHAGSKSHHCSRCDEVKDVTEIAKDNHSYGEWTTTKEPTYEEAGLKERVCSVCGHIETEELAALGYSQAFIDYVSSIDVNNDSSSELFAKIKQALIYYNLVEDKDEMNNTYNTLKEYIRIFNDKVSTINDNHNQTSNSTLAIVLGLVVGLNLLAIGIIIFKRGVDIL